jgi:hypothetical protein
LPNLHHYHDLRGRSGTWLGGLPSKIRPDRVFADHNGVAGTISASRPSPATQAADAHPRSAATMGCRRATCPRFADVSPSGSDDPKSHDKPRPAPTRKRRSRANAS